LSLGLDGYGYTNSYTSGYLVSARAGKRLGAGHSLDVIGGLSRYDLKAGGPSRSTQWLRGIARVNLGHGIGLAGDVEYNRGDDARGPRAFAELGYRF